MAVKTPPPNGTARAPVPTPDAKPLAGGRVTIDATQGLAFGFGVGRAATTFSVVLPPENPEGEWVARGLDADAFASMYSDPGRLLELLTTLSPDMNRATWDWLRYMNPGWEFDATPFGSDVPSDDLHAVIDAVLARIGMLHGSVDVLIGRMNIAALLSGAFFSELVLDADGRTFVDLATPDPLSVRFKRVVDPRRGTTWQLGQQDLSVPGGFRPVDAPTVRYIPVDPFPGKPYGRSVVSAAIFPTLFLLGLLHDLRRVVAQQGYPRIDVAIILENLRKAMPQSVLQDPKKARQWVDDVITEVQKVYRGLQPDDAYVHTDVIEVNRPVGTIDASSLGAVDGLIDSIERMSLRALKTIPLLMGITDGVSEANANRQYEAFIQGIKAMQHDAEAMLGYQLTLYLRAQGIAARCTWRFAENRASEMQRDAITQQLAINNASRKRDEGWITQAEASEEVTGHEPSAGAERLAGPSGPPAGGLNTLPSDGALPPDPGANRKALVG